MPSLSSVSNARDEALSRLDKGLSLKDCVLEVWSTSGDDPYSKHTQKQSRCSLKRVATYLGGSLKMRRDELFEKLGKPSKAWTIIQTLPDCINTGKDLRQFYRF